MDTLESAHIKEYSQLYRDSLADPQKFWSKNADELECLIHREAVLDDSTPPFDKWFIGGITYIVLNARDRHVKTFRKHKLALIWEGEPGDVRTYSYFSLHREVYKFSIVLRSMGVKSGHRSDILAPNP